MWCWWLATFGGDERRSHGGFGDGRHMEGARGLVLVDVMRVGC